MASRFFSLRRLSTQITLVFGALVTSLAILLSFVYGEMLQRQSRLEAADSLHVVASNIGKMLANDLFERCREVQVLAESQALWKKGLDSEEVQLTLARSQAIRPNSLWIGVADTQGVVRSATADLLLGQDVSARPWFAAGLKGVHVGDVHLAKLLAAKLPATRTGEPQRFVDFAAPIANNGKTLGVLAIHGSWDWAREVTQAMMPANMLEKGLSAHLFDRTGELIYAPDGATEKLKSAGQKLPFKPDLSEQHRSRDLASVVIWQDGQRYLTSVVSLEARNLASDLGWYVVVRQPVEQAFALARVAIFRAMALGITVALLASLVAWLAARRLSGDLHAMTVAVREMRVHRRGELPQFRSSQEVSALSVALHGMTQSLLHNQEQLEAQVRRRTYELEKVNLELAQLAQRDVLTGLLNRRGFETQLKVAMSLALRSSRPLSLVMVDVDHFKRINDTFGHAIGDVVLKYMGQALPQQLRESDVVARLGGEEFVLMLPDTDATGARVIAEQIIKNVAAHVDPVYGHITVSAGVATTSPGEGNAELTLRHADEALYEAKGQGRNRVCVYDPPE